MYESPKSDLEQGAMSSELMSPGIRRLVSLILLVVSVPLYIALWQDFYLLTEGKIALSFMYSILPFSYVFAVNYGVFRNASYARWLTLIVLIPGSLYFVVMIFMAIRANVFTHPNLLFNTDFAALVIFYLWFVAARFSIGNR